MKKKRYTIEQLYNDKLLASKVNTMLEDPDYTLNDIVEFCGEQGFEISKSSLSRYSTKRKESIETGEDLGDLVRDGREKNGTIVSINRNKNDEQSTSGYLDNDKKVVNVIEALDKMIDKGSKGIDYLDSIPNNDWFKAIDLKYKITGGKDQGFTTTGLNEILLNFQIRSDIMLEIIAQYIPEEEHEKIFKEIDDKVDEYYRDLDLTKEQEDINKYIDDVLG